MKMMTSNSMMTMTRTAPHRAAAWLLLVGWMMLCGMISPFQGVEAGVASVVTLAGSGTTNPSKCYWLVLNEMQKQSKLPIWLTYRAVGSTVGQTELVNNGSAVPAADFSSGDIPVTAERYQQLRAANIEMVHLPVLVGTVSFFHSIPNTVDLNMTGALLAQIYMFNITSWDHPDIKAINPSLTYTGRIYVARRAEGSSSTSTATEFMSKSAPDIFPSTLVGAMPAWPITDDNAAFADYLLVSSGSGGMADSIKAYPGAIGYVETGHGVDAALDEVRVQNPALNFLTVQDSVSKGGIEVAEQADMFPESADADFSSVSFINRPGDWTWPMVLITYIYVRKDFSPFLKTSVEQGLLLAFLEALYDEDYVDICVEQHGFMLPDDSVKEYGIKALALLKAANPNATQFVVEKDTQVIAGAADHVLSTKRLETDGTATSDNPALDEALSEIELSIVQLSSELQGSMKSSEELQKTFATKLADVDLLHKKVTTLEDELSQLQAGTGSTGAGGGGETTTSAVQSSAMGGGAPFTDEDEQKLKSALALSILSFVLWVFMFVVTVMSWVRKP